MKDCCLEIRIKSVLKTGFRGTALDIGLEMAKTHAQMLLIPSDISKALGRMTRRNEVMIIGNKYPYYNPTVAEPVFAIAS